MGAAARPRRGTCSRRRQSAQLGLGFVRSLAKDEAVDAARSGAIETLLDWRPTAAGDTWLVPARTVHAIGAGLTILEVQEQSDITYRLYDYGRPRELHLDRGFEVADLGPYAIANTHAALDAHRERLTSCTHFTMERWRPVGTLAFTPGEPFYHLLVVTAGQGTAAGQPTRRGDVWLVPAASEPFTVELAGGEAVVAYTSPSPTRGFAHRAGRAQGSHGSDTILRRRCTVNRRVFLSSMLAGAAMLGRRPAAQSKTWSGWASSAAGGTAGSSSTPR
jgi:hypothetical protein